MFLKQVGDYIFKQWGQHVLIVNKIFWITSLQVKVTGKIAHHWINKSFYNEQKYFKK